MNLRRVKRWLAMLLALFVMPSGVYAEVVTNTWEFDDVSYCNESAQTLNGWTYSCYSAPFFMDKWYFQAYGHSMTSPVSFPAVIKRVTVTAGTNSYDGKITINGQSQEMPQSSYTPVSYQGMYGLPTAMTTADYVFEDVTRNATSPLVISFDYSDYLTVEKIVVECEPESYGFSIAGTEITSETITQFSGLSFAPETCTLTMNNATLQDGIISTLPNMMVVLRGTNTIQSEFAFSADTEEESTLTIAVEGNSAQLLTNTTDEAALFSGYGATILPEQYFVSFDAYGHYSVAKGLKVEHHYYARINDVDTEVLQPVTEANYDKLAGVQDETGATTITATYNASSHTVTLDGYSNIVWGHYDDQYTFVTDDTIDKLTVYLKGENTITTREDGAFFSGNNLTFSTDAYQPGSLKIVREEESSVPLFVLPEGQEVAFANGLTGLSVPEERAYYVMMSYGLTVAGVPVTALNAGNITGEGITGEGTMNYDNSSKTLTLNNVNLTMSQSGPVIVSNLSKLTVKINGTNAIHFSDDVEPTVIIKSNKAKAELYLNSDDYETASLFIYRGNELENFTEGFPYVYYNDLALHHRQGGEELSMFRGVTIYGVTTDDGQPSFAIDTDGLDCKYSIEYVDPEHENVAVTPYDEAVGGPVLMGPCTVEVQVRHGSVTTSYYGVLYDIVDHITTINESFTYTVKSRQWKVTTIPTYKNFTLPMLYEMEENDVAVTINDGQNFQLTGNVGEVDIKATIIVEKDQYGRSVLNDRNKSMTFKLKVVEPQIPFYYARTVAGEEVRNWSYYLENKKGLDGQLTGVITPDGSDLPVLKVTEDFEPYKGKIIYYVDDKSVATVNKTTGEITVNKWGASVVVTAQLAESFDKYDVGYAEFTLITDDGSPLKVGDVSVTSENRQDVLGDGGSVQFDDKQTLVLRNANLTAPIKTRLDNLKVFLLGDNKITTDGPCFISQPEGKVLTITTEATQPGSLTMVTAAENGVIYKDFDRVDYDQDLLVMARTANSELVAMPITPIVESDEQEAEVPVAGAQGENLSGHIYDNVLYTLTEDDSYNASGQNIDLYTTMVDDIDDVVSSYQPGTQEFADNFAGLTFMVPAGTGNVLVEAKTGADGMLGVKIGGEEPVNIRWDGDFKQFTIPYACTEATYVYIYNASQPVAALHPNGFRPAGKKTTITVGIRSVGAKAADVQVSNNVTGVTTGRVPLSSSDVMYGAMGSTGTPAIVVANAPAVNELDQLEEGFFSSYGYASFIDLRYTSLTGINVSRTEGPFKGVSQNTFIFMPAGNSSQEANVIIGTVCPNVQLDGNMPVGEMFGLPDSFSASKVTLNRTFDPQQATTVYLPIDIDAEAAAELGAFYDFDRVENGFVKVDKVEDGLTAHTPYIFIPAADNVQIARRVAVVHATEEAPEARTMQVEEAPVTANLVGCYAHYTAMDNDSFLFTAGADLEHTTFSRMQAANSVLPFQAYLRCQGVEADELKVTDDESILGITTVSLDRKNAETWYTIDGIRLKDKPANKGVYISNGQQKMIR